MSSLAPCPACQRHVRITDTVCPFCSTACSFAGATARRVLPRGLKRAAVFALSASVSATACGGEADDGLDDSVMPVYGAPVSPTDTLSPQPSQPPQPGPMPGPTTTPTTTPGPEPTDQPVYGAPVGPSPVRPNPAPPTPTTPIPEPGPTLSQPLYGAPFSPDDTAVDAGVGVDTGPVDTTAGNDTTSGTADAGRARDSGPRDESTDGGETEPGTGEGAIDGGAAPVHPRDAGLLTPEPEPTAVPVYGAPPSDLQ